MKWLLIAPLVVAGLAAFWALGGCEGAGCSHAGMDCSKMGMKCHGEQGDAVQAGASSETHVAVNDRCPIMGGQVAASAGTRSFAGKTVGFCCPACPGQWDKLSDQEKQRRLEKVAAAP